MSADLFIVLGTPFTFCVVTLVELTILVHGFGLEVLGNADDIDGPLKLNEAPCAPMPTSVWAKNSRKRSKGSRRFPNPINMDANESAVASPKDVEKRVRGVDRLVSAREDRPLCDFPPFRTLSYSRLRDSVNS